MQKQAKAATTKAATTTKASKASKATKAAAPVQAKLTPNQLRLLAVIGASKAPVSYKAMRQATGMRKGLSKAVGTPSKQASAPHTLLAQGLVSVVNASVPFTFAITAAGKAALPKATK